MDRPHRRYEMVFTIGADSFEEMLRSIEQFIIGMRMYHPNGTNLSMTNKHSGVSGGPDAGYSYDIIFYPEWDHDRYFAALEKKFEDGEL